MAMRPRALAAAVPTLLLLLLASPVHAANVTVTLSVNASITFPYDEPAFTLHSCAVSVPTGSDGGDVLDAAVTAGCIGNWSAIVDPTFGRLLHGITAAGASDSTDGRNEYSARFLCGAFPPPKPGGSILFASYGFAINGAAAATGIDGYTVAAGDSIEFHYIVDTCTNANSLAFIALGTWPESPVPLQGTAATDPGTL
jgi:hypothetical protein